MTHNESGQCACGGNCSCQTTSEGHEVAYLTREQYIMKLEEYLVDLRAEIVAVEAELSELKTPVLLAPVG